jgi:hypothetical protein
VRPRTRMPGEADSLKRLACALLALALTACSTTPSAPLSGPTTETTLLLLRPQPAHAVQLTTRGRLQPEYRAVGQPGEPLPYEHAVDTSLVMCAGLGPLFGACAGVMIGALAVAGVTTAVVDGMARAEIETLDSADATRYLAPDTALASTLGAHIARRAFENLQVEGRQVGLLPTASAEGCGLRIADFAPARVADVDIVGLELEFEPGYQYRLIVIARARTRGCDANSRGSERRLAYRGRLLVMSRDANTASRLFDAEMMAAIDVLGRDVAAHLGGRPRG